MLETQMKGKVKFPSRTHDRLNANFISLINSMLEVDVTKRYNIDKVLKHPWLADVAKPPPPPPTPPQTPAANVNTNNNMSNKLIFV